jgi:hypothetical protein
MPALQCSTSFSTYLHNYVLTCLGCDKAATENKLPTSTCACGKRAEGMLYQVQDAMVWMANDG